MKQTATTDKETTMDLTYTRNADGDYICDQNGIMISPTGNGASTSCWVVRCWPKEWRDGCGERYYLKGISQRRTLTLAKAWVASAAAANTNV